MKRSGSYTTCADVTVEARGKTKLEIKLSDSPTVAGREWDDGLRDRDLVALVPCTTAGEGVEASDRVTLFSTRALRASAGFSRLGPPKSAAEGAERDRTWPGTVPTRAGRVLEVTEQHVRVVFEGERRYSYRRVETKPFVYLGQTDAFGAGDSLLMGATPGPEDPTCAGDSWNPRLDVGSDNTLDSYVGVKALGAVGSIDDIHLLRSVAENAPDERIALEALGSLARLGDAESLEKLRTRALDSAKALDMSMEAVLILSELGSPEAAAALESISLRRDLHEEVRAAAVWGQGLQPGSREPLLELLGDESNLVAIHADVALGSDLPEHLLDKLRSMLGGPDRQAAAATRVLVSQGTSGLRQLMRVASAEGGRARDWAIYGLAAAGQQAVQNALGQDATRKLEPILGPFWLGVESWIASPDVVTLIRFVERQRM